MISLFLQNENLQNSRSKKHDFFTELKTKSANLEKLAKYKEQWLFPS